MEVTSASLPITVDGVKLVLGLVIHPEQCRSMLLRVNSLIWIQFILQRPATFHRSALLTAVINLIFARGM